MLSGEHDSVAHLPTTCQLAVAECSHPTQSASTGAVGTHEIIAAKASAMTRAEAEGFLSAVIELSPESLEHVSYRK